MQRLYFAGARDFVLLNSADIGLIPESITDNAAQAGTEATIRFNDWLAAYADYLRTVPELFLQYFDLFGLHHRLVTQYGMDSVRPCREGPPALCEQTLFFDSIHPNARAHRIIGNTLADQLTGGMAPTYLSSGAAEVHTPEPPPIVLLLSGIVLVFLRSFLRISGRQCYLFRRTHEAKYSGAAAAGDDRSLWTDIRRTSGH
jgi:hypothetical protein